MKPGCVNISAATKARLKAYCDLHGISQAKIAERVLDKFLLEQPENLLDEVQVAEEIERAPVSVARVMYERSRRIP